MHVVDHVSHAPQLTSCNYYLYVCMYVCMCVSKYVCSDTSSTYLSCYCACVQASALVCARIEKVGSDHQHWPHANCRLARKPTHNMCLYKATL